MAATTVVYEKYFHAHEPVSVNSNLTPSVEASEGARDPVITSAAAP